MNETESFNELLSRCELCPRRCGVNRLRGQAGRCGMGAAVVAARAALHFWEEPCISGEKGSGTVFFSGCSLGCIYCQNRMIAQEKKGKEISVKHLAEIFCSLQDQGAENINLVTANHFLPQVVSALVLAKEQGLSVPVVYNSSGYERPEMLERLRGLVDIYLPDFKYLDADFAARYSHCPDYPDSAKIALAEMVRQCPVPQFDNRGMMTSGVIVRHLLLPGCGRDSRRILRYLHETYREQIYISILRQYTPMSWIRGEAPELDRIISDEEYRKIVDFAVRLGIEQGFVQEAGTEKESFIPAFTGEGL